MDRRLFLGGVSAALASVTFTRAAAQPPKKRGQAVLAGRIGRTPLVLELHGKDSKGRYRIYAAYGSKRQWLTADPAKLNLAPDAEEAFAEGVTFKGDGGPVTVQTRRRGRVRFSGGPFGPRADFEYSTQAAQGLAFAAFAILVLAVLLALGLLTLISEVAAKVDEVIGDDSSDENSEEAREGDEDDEDDG